MLSRALQDNSVEQTIDRFPNFFIIGAPKCGTTTLFSWLSGHPDTHLPVKEPNYFSLDIYDPFTDQNRERWGFGDYLDRVCPVSMQSKVTGEATPKYLYSDAALNRLYTKRNDIRLIILLRNPVDLVTSLHNQFCKQGVECERHFQKAWVNSENVPDKRLNYRFWGKTGVRLQRVYELFPRDRVLVMLLEEEMMLHPELAYKKALLFLGLADHVLVDYSLSNVATRPRWFFLNLLISRIRKYARRKKIIFTAPFVRKIARVITSSNRTAGKYTSLDEELRQQLVEFYREDVELTAKILGRSSLPWADFFGG